MITKLTDMDGTKAALLRAAGGESSSPVVPPNGLADFGVTFLSNLMAVIKPRLATGGQEYGLASEYAKRVGRSLNTVKDCIAVEMEKKDLLFTSRHKPELFSIGMRACIYCGQQCNGGKIPNAREIFESSDTAQVTAMFYIDADEARQVLKQALFCHIESQNA